MRDSMNFAEGMLTSCHFLQQGWMKFQHWLEYMLAQARQYAFHTAVGDNIIQNTTPTIVS